MATQDLTFSVAALDKASRTFLKVAERVERLEKKLDQLDRTRAEPEVDVDIDEHGMSRAAGRAGRRAGRAFSQGAEDVGRERKSFFFAALFKPDRGVVHALRTGVPAILGSPIGIAAITLGALFAASFVSAVITSGVFALIGAGFTGLAAVVLKENKRLQRSFASLGETAGNQLRQAASGLVPVFEQALGTVQTMFGSFVADPLQRIFEGLGPTIGPAVESAMRTIGGVLDTLATPQVVEGMQTVLGSITRNLPRFGAAFSEFFEELAGDADDIAEAFSGVTTVMTGLIGFAGDLTTALTHVFNRFKAIGNAAGPALSGILGFLGEADRQLREFGGQEEGQQPPLVRFLQRISGNAEIAGGKMAVMRRSTVDLATASEELAEKQRILEGQVDLTSEKLRTERDRLKQLEDGMFSAAEGILGLRDSARTYEEQLDSTSETLRRNGETLDINTEKGRENQGALDAQAASALGHIQIMQQQGKSIEEITEFTRQAREDFLAAADAAGIESEAAEKLADRLGLVPSEVKTKLEAIDNATEEIEDLKARLRKLERKLTRAEIRASVTGVGFANSVLDGIAAQRTATITVRTIGGYRPGFRTSGRAHGGPVFPGQDFLVGERGPELVRFGRSGTVIPAQQTRRIMSGAAARGGGGGTTVQLVNHGVIGSEFELRRWLSDSINELKRTGRLN